MYTFLCPICKQKMFDQGQTWGMDNFHCAKCDLYKSMNMWYPHEVSYYLKSKTYSEEEFKHLLRLRGFW